MKITPTFRGKESKHLYCLELPNLAEVITNMRAHKGFMYYDNLLSELLIFEHNLAKPDATEVWASADIWNRFKNLHGLSKAIKLGEHMREVARVEEDIVWVITNISAELVESSHPMASDIMDRTKLWCWASYDCERDLATALQKLYRYDCLLVCDGMSSHQAWLDFRYIIVYSTMIDYLHYLNEEHLEHDFWIELASRYPMLFIASKEFNWQVHERIGRILLEVHNDQKSLETV
jgi:hypothetical protein